MCGYSSAVEHQLPKLSVASSILVTRSIYAYQLQAFGLELFYLHSQKSLTTKHLLLIVRLKIIGKFIWQGIRDNAYGALSAAFPTMHILEDKI